MAKTYEYNVSLNIDLPNEADKPGFRYGLLQAMEQAAIRATEQFLEGLKKHALDADIDPSVELNDSTITCECGCVLRENNDEGTAFCPECSWEN